VGTALITGVAGLIGSHLGEFLIARGDKVVGAYFRPTIDFSEIAGKFPLIQVDVRYFVPLRDVVAEHLPDVIYHLAAQSLPTVSWKQPWETLDTNVIGTINVFEAVKEIRRTHPDYDPMVVVACSSAEYGASLTPDRVPITEDAPLQPLHPYGVSKVAQDLLAAQYWINDRIRCIRARIFNCTGPRKRDDVVSDFGARLAHIVAEGGKLRVGNLKTRRAIIDVRDMVQALVLLAEKGMAGDPYNICAEKAVLIQEILDGYIGLIGRDIAWEVDSSLLRPSDEPIIFGSTEKLRRDTGWAPIVTLNETLRAVLGYELAKAGQPFSLPK
jgi:GDP-4-dehydro-6-deoxy-D-mannose reductase